MPTSVEHAPGHPDHTAVLAISTPNSVKRVYRIMKAHGLLLERHTGTDGERWHDGRVPVDVRWNLRSAVDLH